jgi:hypothetical protein
MQALVPGRLADPVDGVNRAQPGARALLVARERGLADALDELVGVDVGEVLYIDVADVVPGEQNLGGVAAPDDVAFDGGIAPAVDDRAERARVVPREAGEVGKIRDRRLGLRQAHALDDLPRERPDAPDGRLARVRCSAGRGRRRVVFRSEGRSGGEQANAYDQMSHGKSPSRLKISSNLSPPTPLARARGSVGFFLRTC